VLLAEALELLAVRPGGFYVDGTVGLGGHAAAILEASGPEGHLLGVDRDPQALAQAERTLARFGSRVELRHADYRALPGLLAVARPDGVLLDLGVSALQLDSAERGFSFRAEGPLDMRMDPTRGEPAAEVVNRLPEARLAELIARWGEEPAARRIARALVEARRRAPIRTTTELAALVRRAAGRGRRGIDPATRTFQALRIHVNRELSGLGETLAALADALAVPGRLVVIAFHSLEDRVVKQALRALPRDRYRVLTPKPLRPGAAELLANPRSRSARLRAAAREAA
jgi:16S rRNA (cytosine1402-N4)-methyltransferase